ncbi:hypothetical protein TNCV_4358431 [Trichonephila clavipes]|nr:hypothetical protein TNCV_4358431 [Trichonephila clavipes]
MPIPLGYRGPHTCWTHLPSSRKSSCGIGGRGREAPETLQDVLPQIWGGTEPNRTITCMVLEATVIDRRRPCHDEIVGLDLMLQLIRWHK